MTTCVSPWIVVVLRYFKGVLRIPTSLGWFGARLTDVVAIDFAYFL